MNEPVAALRALLKSVRKNARSRALSVEINLDDMIAMWREGDGRCAITRISFDFRRIGTGRRRPYAPSVDRIECSLGYTKANCRLVCAAVNYALGDWGLDVLRAIAEGIVSQGFAGFPKTRAHGRLRGTYVRHKRGRTFYESFICINGQRRYLGAFDSEIEAHRCWVAARATRDSTPSKFPSDTPAQETQVIDLLVGPPGFEPGTKGL